MPKRAAPTMIAIYVEGASDRRQRELAAYLASIARAAADGLYEDVRVEIPLLTDQVPPRLVQPLRRDDA